MHLKAPRIVERSTPSIPTQLPFYPNHPYFHLFCPYQKSRSHISVVHLVMSNSATPWTVACQASLSFTISWSLVKLMSIELVMPSNYFILYCPLLLLPSIFPSISLEPHKQYEKAKDLT